MNKYLSLTSEYIGMAYKNRNKCSRIQFKNYSPCAANYETLSKFYSPLNITPTYKKSGNMCAHEFGRYYFNELGGNYYRRIEPSALNAIIVHGWKSSNLSDTEKNILNPLLAAEYNVYLPVLPYHMERTPKGSYSGKNMISADIGMTVEAVHKAVCEVRALISCIKAADINNKIFLSGISLGGLIVSLTSCFDENIDVLNPVLYLDSLSFNIWNSKFFKDIKNVFVKSGFSYAELKEKLNILEPSNWMPRVARDNIFRSGVNMTGLSCIIPSLKKNGA